MANTFSAQYQLDAVPSCNTAQNNTHHPTSDKPPILSHSGMPSALPSFHLLLADEHLQPYSKTWNSNILGKVDKRAGENWTSLHRTARRCSLHEDSEAWQCNSCALTAAPGPRRPISAQHSTVDVRRDCLDKRWQLVVRWRPYCIKLYQDDTAGNWQGNGLDLLMRRLEQSCICCAVLTRRGMASIHPCRR